MLNYLRMQINKIDISLISLLSRRFKYAVKIKEEKTKKSLKINDALREKELRNFWSKIAGKEKINAEFVNKLLNLIVKESKRIQNENSK